MFETSYLFTSRFTKEYYDRVLDPAWEKVCDSHLSPLDQSDVVSGCNERLINFELMEIYSLLLNEGVTKDWALTRSPYTVVCILTIYLLVTLKLGPAHMKNRPPYRLENTMRVYNVAQICFNAYLIHKTLSNPWSCIFNTFCQLEEDLKVCLAYVPSFLEVYWLFVVLKIIDLLDTVFIVLRKNDSHLTLLHLYHHVGMVIVTWASFYYFKMPQASVLALVNIFVHLIMYGYYFLTTFPALKRFLWWKRHLTKLQLSQFAVGMFYLSYLLYNSCDISPVFGIMWILNIAIICLFFINFYYKSYIVKSKIK